MAGLWGSKHAPDGDDYPAQELPQVQIKQPQPAPRRQPLPDLYDPETHDGYGEPWSHIDGIPTKAFKP